MRHSFIAATALTLASASCGGTDPLTGPGDGPSKQPGARDPGQPPLAEPSLPARSTMSVSGRHLYSACGEQITLRGVNKMNIWQDKDGSRSFAEIAKTGANTVRIVWDMTGTAEELDTIIARAVSEGLVPMVELHDATGKFEMLHKLVDYWIQPDVVAVITKHQRNLLVNIGNEVGETSDTGAGPT